MGSLKPLIPPAVAESIVAKRGRATANGAGDGSTVVDTDLTEVNDYWNDMTLLILSGASDGQSRDITDFAGGTLTVSPAFSNQIVDGVRYLILPIKPSFAEIADLDVDVANVIQQVALTGHPANSIGKILYDFYITRLTAARCGYLAELAAANIPSDIDDIKARTDNLSGAEGEDTVTTLNAYGGTASSGDTGADVLTISTSTRKKIHFLGIDISGLTAGAKATIRLYTKILNADASLTKFYDQDFTVGTDPDLIPVIDGSMGIRNDLRVEIQSDNASDTSVTVKYCHITENME